MGAPVRPPKYRFYLPGDHSALERLGKRLQLYRPVPAFPKVVQIQTRTGCNADCVFCPYGETADIVPKGRMDDALFARVVEECGRHGVSRISPYLMNEPFVDVELLDRVAVIKERAPGARVCITTNGEPMTPKVADRMLAQDAVHRLYVSVQGVEAEAYEKSMRGPRLARVLDNVMYLHDAKQRRGASRPKLTGRTAMVGGGDGAAGSGRRPLSRSTMWVPPEKRKSGVCRQSCWRT